MALFPKLKIDPPGLANHNLRHYFRTSMAPGPLYPVLCMPVNAGETYHLDLESLVNTQALLSPLYGSYDIQFDIFFAGTSLYVPRMWRNGSLKDSVDGTVDVGFPTFKLPLYDAVQANAPFLISNNSALSYLGFNPGFSALASSPDASATSVSNRSFNLIPYLMYLDCVRNYYINRQERYCYMMVRDSENTDPNVFLSAPFKISVDYLDRIFEILPASGGDVELSLRGSEDYNVYTGVILNGIISANSQLGGLFLRTYRPDKMNVILGNSFVSSNSVKVATMSDGFTIDQLVQAKKVWDGYKKDSMTNGTFKDWVRSHFGVTPKIMDDIPTFCGSTSSPIIFEDIRATTSNQIGEATQYLGDKASSGSGYFKSRRHVISVDRPGYIMVIASITPRVDYYQNLERYTCFTKLSDLFMPEYNGIGLQDVLVSDLCADFSGMTDQAIKESEVPMEVSAGYQPAWIEYMTKVNQVRGSFCSTEKSWVLSRDMRVVKTDPARGPVENSNASAYVLPGDWNQPFAVQDVNYENFLVQIYFDLVSRSPVKKRLMPYFGK